MRSSRQRPHATRLRQPETLESRWLMSGDGVGIGPGADTVQTASEAEDTPETFESLAALRQWITAQAIERYGDLFGTTETRPRWGWNWCDCAFDGELAVPVAFNRGVANDSAIDYSTTNTQVAGVDEADLVETDGEFLYLISGDELVIVDARDPDDLGVLSRVELPDTPSGMYLDGDRLTIVSTSRPAFGFGRPVFLSTSYWGGQAHAPTVTVAVLDLTDRSAPTQVEQTEIDGELVSSRLVDGQLRLVTTQSLNRYLPSPNYTATPVEEGETEESESGIREASLIAIDYHYRREYEYTYESLDEYVDRVLAQWAPGYRTLDANGEVIDTGFLVDPTDIEVPDAQNLYAWNYYGQQHTTVMTFDVSDTEAGPSDTHVIATGYNVQLHGTEDGLYLLTNSRYPHWNTRVSIGHVYTPPQTEIWKLSFGEDGAIDPEATGTVMGHLPEQFAADEHDGYLRLVTSTGHWRSDQRLVVLEQRGEELVEVGAINSLAPNENIHSVRFMGDEAYVVTFRKVDPLFAIDLSDPTSPQVKGELKIPGFSDYLQPIGENHLLGIGRGADEAIGRFQELQVSIFDVTDLSDPQLTHRHSIDGGRTTWTIATGWTDGAHHAVGFYEDEGVLALPIHGNGGRGGWRFGVDNTPIFEAGQGGLLALSIDVTAGISEIALIEHETPIQRSLRIGDTLFAISSGVVSTHDFGDLTGELDRLDLTGAATSRLNPYRPVTRESFEPDAATATTEALPRTRERLAYAPVARESFGADSGERFTAAPSRVTPAARDAALLLIDDEHETDDDSDDSGVARRTEEAEPHATADRVRSAWRPSVRG